MIDFSLILWESYDMLFECKTCKEFLRAELAQRLSAHPRYSQRAFARDLGLSPGEISEVLVGKRKLSVKSAMKIAQTLHLSPGETRHWLLMAQLDGAEIGVGQAQEEGASLSVEMFRVVSHWYCFAILNLSECPGFRWQPRWISKRLGITPNEVRFAMDRLLKVGLIERKGRNYQVTKDFVMSSEGVPSEAIRNYHRQILQLASRALDTQGVGEREFDGVGLAVNPKRIPEMKMEIRQFLDEVVNKYGNGKNRTEVYQMELSFFRLTENV